MHPRQSPCSRPHRYPEVVIHNPGQFLLAFELSTLDENPMLQRFDRSTLVSIQETLLLEPTTASRLATALELTK